MRGECYAIKGLRGPRHDRNGPTKRLVGRSESSDGHIESWTPLRGSGALSVWVSPGSLELLAPAVVLLADDGLAVGTIPLIPSSAFGQYSPGS